MKRTRNETTLPDLFKEFDANNPGIMENAAMLRD